MAVEITDSNYNELVQNSDKPVMIDFWAEWCGPCRMVGPIVEEMSGDYAGKAVIGKVNVDENPQVAQTYGVESIPTLMLFQNGEPKQRFVGGQPKSRLQGALDELIA